jgi:hypothetical protein
VLDWLVKLQAPKVTLISARGTISFIF